LLGGAGMRRVWAVIFVLLLAWVLAVALSPQPRGPSLGLDKANHLAAFAALAMSGLLAGRGRAGQAAWLAAGLLGLGIAIEIAQAHIPGRSPELLDMLADAAGIAIGVALGAALSRQRAAAGPASPPPAR
jgi:VanZ family protein